MRALPLLTLLLATLAASANANPTWAQADAGPGPSPDAAAPPSPDAAAPPPADAGAPAPDAGISQPEAGPPPAPDAAPAPEEPEEPAPPEELDATAQEDAEPEGAASAESSTTATGGEEHASAEGSSSSTVAAKESSASSTVAIEIGDIEVLASAPPIETTIEEAQIEATPTEEKPIEEMPIEETAEVSAEAGAPSKGQDEERAPVVEVVPPAFPGAPGSYPGPTGTGLPAAPGPMKRAAKAAEPPRGKAESVALARSSLEPVGASGITGRASFATSGSFFEVELTVDGAVPGRYSARLDGGGVCMLVPFNIGPEIDPGDTVTKRAKKMSETELALGSFTVGSDGRGRFKAQIPASVIRSSPRGTLGRHVLVLTEESGVNPSLGDAHGRVACGPILASSVPAPTPGS